MKLTLDDDQTGYIIRGYDDSIIRTNSGQYSKSLIISTNKLIENWEPNSIAELEVNHFKPALDLNPEIILIGTGSNLKFPNNEVLADIYRVNCGVEIMNTPAACRTYNLLSSENRKVVACLIIDSNKLESHTST